MHTNVCEINGMYIVEDISRSVMIENKRKIVTTEFVLVHLSVQLAQSPFDMVTQKKNTIISIKTIDSHKMSTKKVSSTLISSNSMSFQNQISILHNLFIMILEWGNTSFYMQFQKKNRSIVFVMMFDNRLHSEVT